MKGDKNTITFADVMPLFGLCTEIGDKILEGSLSGKYIECTFIDF